MKNIFILLFILAVLSPVSAFADFTNSGPNKYTRSDFTSPNELESGRPIKTRLTSPLGNIDGELIVLLNGFGFNMDRYQAYADHLASYGFWVLSMDYLRSSHLLDGEHDYKVQQIHFAVTELERRVHRKFYRYGVIGHSLGGKLGFLLAAADTRIFTVVALDPVNSGGASCLFAPTYCSRYPTAPNPGRSQRGILADLQISSLIMRSSPDRLLNPEEEFNAQWFFHGSDGIGKDGVPGFALYYDFGKLSHSSYVPTRRGPVRNLIFRTLTAWFYQQFYGNAHQDILMGSVIQRDIENGILDSFLIRN